MTAEKEQAIVALYKAGRYNSDICVEYGIPKNELYDILAKYDVPRKQVKGSYTKKQARCRSCGEVIGLKSAKFCPHCGRYIMTEREMCLNVLKGLKTKESYIPKIDRDKYLADLEMCISYLIKEGVKDEQ